MLELTALKDSCQNENMDFVCPPEEVFKLRKKVPTVCEDGRTVLMPNSAYLDFCDYMLPSVVGKLEWKKCKFRKKLSEFVTILDEAFVLLAFENNYERWHAQYEADQEEEERIEQQKRANVNKKQSKKKKDKPTAIGNSNRDSTMVDRERKTSAGAKVNVPAKWTNNRSRNDIGSNRKLNGWSDAAMTRFNELVSLVEEDRQSDHCEEFELAFIEKLKEGMQCEGQVEMKADGRKHTYTVPIRNHLFGDMYGGKRQDTSKSSRDVDSSTSEEEEEDDIGSTRSTDIDVVQGVAI